MAIKGSADQTDGNFGSIAGLEWDALIVIVLNDGPCRFKIGGYRKANAQRILEAVAGVIRAGEGLRVPAAEIMAVVFQVSKRVGEIAQYGRYRDRVRGVAEMEVGVVEWEIPLRVEHASQGFEDGRLG